MFLSFFIVTIHSTLSEASKGKFMDNSSWKIVGLTVKN